MKNMNIYCLADLAVLAFLGGGEVLLFHTIDFHLLSGSYKNIHISFVVMMRCKNCSPSRSYRRRNSVEQRTRFCFSSSLRIWGTHLARTSFIPRSAFNTLCTVDLPKVNLAPISRTVRLRSSLMTSLTLEISAASAIFSSRTCFDPPPCRHLPKTTDAT